MIRIVSFYRCSVPVTNSQGKKRKIREWIPYIKERIESHKNICELPVRWEEAADAKVGYVGIPASFVAMDQILQSYLEAVIVELAADYFYIEPPIQKKLCMSESGRQLFEHMSILMAKDYLYPWWELFLREENRKTGGLTVFMNYEQLNVVRELLMELAEGRNEMRLIFGEENIPVAALEQVEDLSEDLAYEYGLMLQTGGTGALGEGEEEWLVIDLQTKGQPLVKLLNARRKEKVWYLDAMPTPEKEKIGACRNRTNFVYRSIGEKWRATGGNTIDSDDKSSYNAMNENRIMKWVQYRRILDRKGNHYGRKEKHIDL